MKSKPIAVVLLASLIIAPAAFSLAVKLGGNDSGMSVTRLLFALTVVVEIAALMQVILSRRMFSPSDPMHLTWTLIAAFLIVRLLGQVRLLTLTFNFIPTYSETGPRWLFYYVVWGRYLYTLGDLLFVASLITTVRAYKLTGLKFELIGRDFLYISILWVIPFITYVFRQNLALGGIITTDGYVVTYRLIAVFVGALIASLCVAIRRYTIQMGGGMVARVWNTVVLAGTARALSFLVLSLMLRWWKPGAQFAEQYLLWIFAACWLIAALYQQEVLPRAREK